MALRTGRGRAAACAAALLMTAPAGAWAAADAGPFNADIAGGGEGLAKATADLGSGPWTLQAWVSPRVAHDGVALVAGVGPPGSGVFLALRNGQPAMVTSQGTVAAGAVIAPGRWVHLAVVSDGHIMHLYADGVQLGGLKSPPAVTGPLLIGPRMDGAAHFNGRVAGLSATAQTSSPSDLRRLASQAPKPELIGFEPDSPVWPVQVRQMYGQTSPQDPATLPRSKTGPSAPVAKPVVPRPVLEPTGSGVWTVNGWRLAEGPKVAAGGPDLSQPGFDARGWYAATVPGTVLTTLVDRGVYPDPAYGLNMMAIPETLARQDYWYRTEFATPAQAAGRRFLLTFKGVNYAAEVWVNGRRVGDMKGAFVRGRFDVTGLLNASGPNAIAVKVSPPPHPGLNQEESLTSGVGENGGMQMLDGPTFVATEGWDWIPTVRDRNTGMWQGVELAATGDLRLGDAHVVTTLPRPDNSVADVEIIVPVQNLSAQPMTAQVTASFDDVRVSKAVTVAAGATGEVTLSPAEFAQLSVRNPRLWWPNGYGAPALHTLHLAVSAQGAASDAKDVRFGMRQVTYDISLMDHTGELRRVGLDLSKARSLHQQVVDGTHEGIRKVANGYAYSLTAAGETSPAITPVTGQDGLSPYMVIKVNGVRIAARGGNIGMDDFMKRVGRDRLEPFFRLHRDAHLNIVRNWVGQDSEETFYDLADEYGMMILNDFWESTQDYNIEAQDEQLFAANAQEVITRFRNHPSIVVWFGRNEGVPQPLLNEMLQDRVNRYDGTRLYMGSSNRISLQNSGPYNWRPPVEYFTEHAKGFSVESGTPSFPTLEAWKRAIPATELWPISDTWAYHDWHQSGNGAVKSYMDNMAAQVGAATSLEDFERKAQLQQYVAYRAIFEGFNAGLWTTNSGRMLWMTQPAWPSSAWQIFSSDYDTQGSFYGVKIASEPVHVQMNLPDYKVIVVNNPMTPLIGAVVDARVVSLDNQVLAQSSTPVSAPGGAKADALKLDLEPLLTAHGLVLVRLELRDASGAVLSRNVYWQGKDDASYQALNTLAPARLALKAATRTDGADAVTTVDVSNPGKTPALTTKLTLLGADGKQILPAYFSENYLSLLPGEHRAVQIRYAPSASHGPVSVTVRGWNVAPGTVRADIRK